jgi:hypothetical protein
MAANKNTLSWVAIFISVGAAVLSGLQWWESHQSLQLSMRPSVSFEVVVDAEDFPKSPLGISIKNSGPGPAIIQSVVFYINGKNVGGSIAKEIENRGWQHHFQYYTFDPGDTLAVNEQQWLLRTNASNNPNDAPQIVDFLSHLNIKVTFCPILTSQPFTRCSTTGGCGSSK